MNLATTYLGLNLRTPLVPSASPLTHGLDNIRRMEDAGASAIVLHSLFEEQIRRQEYQMERDLLAGGESYPEALDYLPQPASFKTGPDAYLALIDQAKEAVRIPIIASLNGSTTGGWTDYARQMQAAGADALELNIYSIPTDFDMNSAEVEQQCLGILQNTRSVVTIPVAVKVSPFFSNFANMSRRLEQVGADGLVLFNRFYQPDVDTEALEIAPSMLLSTPMAMRLPLTWIGLLFGRVRMSLAATSGIHRGLDVIKMLMVGADVTMLCSVLLRRGIGQLRTIEQQMTQWMEEHSYESVQQLKGSLSQKNCPNPEAFERAQYIHNLTTYADSTFR